MCSLVTKPDAFLSYTRFDDRYGKVAEFRKHLSDIVEEVSGDRFEIFHDVDDETGVRIGQNWNSVLDAKINETRFFIPILTPKFFKSRNCRNELRNFLKLEKEAGRDDLILPIYFIESRILEDPMLLANDDLAQVVSARQFWDWRKLRKKRINSTVVVDNFERLARQIELRR